MSTSSQAYSSDLSDAEWNIISALLPKNEGGPGRPIETCLRSVVNAIMYLNRGGNQWGLLPSNFPPKGTVYYHFRKWALDGTLEKINQALCKMDRELRDREPVPTGAAIDSQSTKTTEVGGKERGTDTYKRVNGRKRNIIVDTLGNLWAAFVNAASSDDREGIKQAFAKLPQEVRFSIQKIWADGGYRGEPFETWLQQNIQCEIEIAVRPPNAEGFILVPVRWVVERTFAWLGRYRRLSKDYERCTKSSEAMIYLASIRTMLKRIAAHA